jgi:hypothetical protein
MKLLFLSLNEFQALIEMIDQVEAIHATILVHNSQKARAAAAVVTV